MATVIKVDKNGTKYWFEVKCPRCGGSGYIYGYEHVEGGICFKCNGSGRYEHSWKEYTPEYAQKLDDRRLAKAKKTAPARNAALLKKLGFDENGKAWIVVGNTFEIKDQLKAAGAKFNDFGWHFDHEVADFPVHEVDILDFAEVSIDGSYQLGNRGDILNYTKELRDKYAPRTNSSEYVGSVGEKLELSAKYLGCSSYETHYTYYGETHNVYKFEDENGNMLIWNTGSFQKFEEGKIYQLKGSVKEHSEYKGNKQTVLTRCKVRAA